MFRGFLDAVGDAFWGGVAALIGLAVIVTVLRVTRNKVPVTSGVINKTAQVTGVGI